MTCLEKKKTDNTSERSEAKRIEKDEEGDKNAEETGRKRQHGVSLRDGKGFFLPRDIACAQPVRHIDRTSCR